jgi:hypothetical protein
MAPAFDSRLRQWSVAILAFLVGLALAAHALAVPVSVSHTDLPTCDFLSVPPLVDELGDTSAFPPDERITAVDLSTVLSGCPATDTPAPNVLVAMTNLTTLDFVEVWYVADPETSLSNVDGLVEGEEAFQIDSVGLNTPLVFESMQVNGIFEAGETWEFVIDDYFNALGLAADDFFSPGAVGTFSPGGPSSGSVIAFVPEPATALLLAGGLAGLAAAGRRRSLH